MVKYGFLHCHGMHSLNDSTASPEELVCRAKEMGAPAITLTDHGTMLGIEPFMLAGKKYGVNTIPGMEIYLENNEHFLLAARDFSGYQALCWLLRHAEYVMNKKTEKVRALIPYQVLRDMPHKENVIATSACIQGPLGASYTKKFKEENKIKKLEAEMEILKPDYDGRLYASKKLSEITERISFLKKNVKDQKKFLSPSFKKQLAKEEKNSTQLSFLENSSITAERMRKQMEFAIKETARLEQEISRAEEEKKSWNSRKKELKRAYDKYLDKKEKIDVIRSGLIPDDVLYAKTKEYALYYKSIFPNFFIELQNHGLDMERVIYPILAKIAKETGIPVIAANDAHMVSGSEDCIEARRLIRFNYFSKHMKVTQSDREMYLKSDEELSAALLQILDESTVQEAMDNLSVLSECHVVFPEEKHYPKVPSEVSFDSLIQKARKEKIEQGEWGPEYEQRLACEVSVMKKIGVTDYHLVVRDFCIMGKKLGLVPKEDRKYIPDDFSKLDEWLKSRGYTCGEGIGPGRGSAVGSLVCYLLGITNIDPVKYGLLFERYLNLERVTMPDIDTDVATSIRPILIKYLYWKYGVFAVASISTETTYAAKGAIKMAGREKADRLYGHLQEKKELISAFMNKRINPIADNYPEHISLKKAAGCDLSTETDPEVIHAARYLREQSEQDIIKKAVMLEGKLFTTGIHAGGVVISDNEDISRYVPTVWNEKQGVWAVECDMVRVEERHLLKMDLLGLTTLDINTDCLHLIAKHEGLSIDLNSIPFEKEVFADIFAKGFTNSVFQFESDGMKKMLCRFSPDCFEDIILLVAAYRPGPMQYLDDIIDIKNGRKKVSYLTPELEPILSITYGATIYQEQVMRIFRDLAGYSLGGADLVRRAMSKKKMDKLEKERDAFIHGDLERGIHGCTAAGIKESTANRLFDQMMDFARYAFNKSHAAVYAYLAYQTAYLKYHYPKYFACAMFNNKEQEKFAPILSDCLEQGITVLPPSIRKSAYLFTVEGNCIRYGYSGIKGIGKSAAPLLENLRQYNSFLGFFKGCCMGENPFSKNLVEPLVYAGVFDSICPDRDGLFAYYKNLSRFCSNLGSQDDVCDKVRFFPGTIHKKALFEKEMELLGSLFSQNPLKDYGKPAFYGCRPYGALKAGSNQIMGYVSKYTAKTSRKGNALYIIEITGYDGTLSVTAMQKALPAPEQYMFQVVKIRVNNGEDGLFLQNISFLPPIPEKKEALFLCDSTEKYEFLRQLLHEEQAKDDRPCILHVINFINKTGKESVGKPYAVLLSEAGLRQVKNAFSS